MDQWTLYGADLVDGLARRDPVFCRMLARHQVLVIGFDALMETLPPDQRELILEYLNLALDMEARKTQLALNRK